MRRAPALTSALAIALLSIPAIAADACADGPVCMEARTDQQPTGNRVVPTRMALEGSVLDVELPAPVAWVLPDPAAPGRGWIVAEEDGTLRRVSDEGHATVGQLPPGVAPAAVLRSDGSVSIGDDSEDRLRFDDPLPDARVVRLDDSARAALVGPTGRYEHGVLGDGVEASAVEIVGDGGDGVRMEIEPDAVVEGISPLLADVSGDGRAELLVTVSDEDSGARLRLYDQAGAIVAESDPIGQGYRWLHQLGVGPTGPGGETEIIAVRTPHIGGIVEAYRLRDRRLERVATQPGYSSHLIGSRNLDMALLADTDADGSLEVVVPTQAMTALGVLAREGDGFTVLDTLLLDGRLTSNLAGAVDAEGRLHVAAATDDGRLRVFR